MTNDDNHKIRRNNNDLRTDPAWASMSVPSLDSSKLLQAAAMESATLVFWIVGFSRWLQSVFWEFAISLSRTLENADAICPSWRASYSALTQNTMFWKLCLKWYIFQYQNALISTCARFGERPRPTRVHDPYSENTKRHNFKIRRSNGSVCPHDQLLFHRSVGLWSVRPAVGQPQSDFVGSLIELVPGMRFTRNW